MPTDGPAGARIYTVTEGTYNEMLSLTSMAIEASEAEVEAAAQDLEEALTEMAPVIADNLAAAPGEEDAAEQ